MDSSSLGPDSTRQGCAAKSESRGMRRFEPVFPVLNGSLILKVGMAQMHAERGPRESGTPYSSCTGEASLGFGTAFAFTQCGLNFAPRANLRWFEQNAGFLRSAQKMRRFYFRLAWDSISSLRSVSQAG